MELIKIKKKNKRGVSEMVGYVLLITLAVVMGIIAYNWMKTYVPKGANECPDGISLFIEKSELNYSSGELKVTLKNNGRFDVYGYFIYGKNTSTQEIATNDLSSYFNASYGGAKIGNYIKFLYLGQDTLESGDETTHLFNIPFGSFIYSISVIPIRFEKVNNKEKFVPCGKALTSQIIGEPTIECTAESSETTCIGRNCGSKVNNCGDLITCGSCSGDNACNVSGLCAPKSQCSSETCATYGYVCGNWTICGTEKICGSLNGDCASGYECNVTGQCNLICGNGKIDSPESCDIGANNGQVCTPPSGGSCTYCSSTCQIVTVTIGNNLCDPGETCEQEPTACQGRQATCQSGSICIGGSCQPISSGLGCNNYCISLLHSPPYITSSCVHSPGQCSGPAGGNLESGGDSICTQQNSNTPLCCCFT